MEKPWYPSCMIWIFADSHSSVRIRLNADFPNANLGPTYVKVSASHDSHTWRHSSSTHNWYPLLLCGRFKRCYQWFDSTGSRTWRYKRIHVVLEVYISWKKMFAKSFVLFGFLPIIIATPLSGVSDSLSALKASSYCGTVSSRLLDLFSDT